MSAAATISLKLEFSAPNIRHPNPNCCTLKKNVAAEIFPMQHATNTNIFITNCHSLYAKSPSLGLFLGGSESGQQDTQRQYVKCWQLNLPLWALKALSWIFTIKRWASILVDNGGWKLINYVTQKKKLWQLKKMYCFCQNCWHLYNFWGLKSRDMIDGVLLLKLIYLLNWMIYQTISHRKSSQDCKSFKLQLSYQLLWTEEAIKVP